MNSERPSVRRAVPAQARPIGPWRAAGLILTGLAACLGQAANPTGYLPTLGPAPLRFEARSTIVPVVLPPDSTAAEQRTTNSPPARAAVSQSPAFSVAPPTSISAPETHPVADAPAGPRLAPSLSLTNTGPLSLDMQPVPWIPPQALVQLFTDPSFTNAQVGVSMPISFHPAPPPPQRSSTATYTSPSRP